jgi:hypothetical protein
MTKSIIIKIFSNIELIQTLLMLILLITEFLELYRAGPTRAVADGFYILTQPLAKGTYPIHLKSSFAC